MATSPEVIASLKVDMAMEHAAIIQYVVHGVFLRDSAMTDPVKRVAREEMWHFEWLAEALRDRGSDHTLERAEVFLPRSIAADMMEDVAAEQRAISHYAETLGLIGDSDPDLTKLIERIVEDERHHKARFAGLADEVRSRGDAAYAAHPMMQPQEIGVAGPTIGTEYATVLQYLSNKFGCGDCDQAEEYFDLAVDEMRHLSWAAAYLPGVVETATAPDVPVERVRLVHSPGEAAQAAGVLEQKAAEFYPAMIEQARTPALRDDLERALGQHGFHRAQLEELG